MKALAIAATCGEILGFLLGSYGVLRGGLAVLAELRAYGEGRFGEGPFGGVPAPGTRWLINFGKSWRLLPRDGKLSLTDQKRNAGYAIAGVLIALASMIAGLIVQIAGPS